MPDIRNLTRNGETFYPLTHIDAVLGKDGKSVKFPVDTTVGVADYEIADEKNNVIVAYKDGEIQTKNFNSRETPNSTNYLIGDFSIADQNNHVLACFKDGHVLTKNFDSYNVIERLSVLETQHQYARFNGKRVSIIGDSISTYSGTMPTGYAVYYPHGEVNDIKYMWWYILCQRLGMSYTNTSWSGSKVTGAPKGTTAAAGCSDKRVQDAGRDGTPDFIIIYLGINDFGVSIQLGNWKVTDSIVDDSEYTTDQAITELRSAFSLMLNKLQIAYPTSRVFVCSLPDTLSYDRASGWPANNNNGVALNEYNSNIREIAEAMDCVFVNLAACGITYNNQSTYMVDGGLHPNIAGQKLIADFLTAQLIANV